MSLKTPETPIASTGDIIRCGVLKKAKTSRKKYFVLRAETPDALARLEYYDSEKKYRAGQIPRRIIPLKACFNINRKPDSKHKHVIGLYTKTYCFCVAFESEDELKVWLKDFLTLQHGEEIPEGEVLKPKFGKFFFVLPRLVPKPPAKYTQTVFRFKESSEFAVFTFLRRALFTQVKSYNKHR